MINPVDNFHNHQNVIELADMMTGWESGDIVEFEDHSEKHQRKKWKLLIGFQQVHNYTFLSINRCPITYNFD